MAPYTTHELEALLADLESDLVERKESLQGDSPRKIRDAVCAFANDLPASLVLGKNPQDFVPAAFAQFLRIAGTDLADPVVDAGRCSGPVAQLVRGLDDKLLAHNRTAVDFTSGPVEVRTPTYPMAALRQLVRNAVMHRTYESTNAPIHVYWFDDRIEITSPGGPYGAVTAENFGRPGIVDYRNQTLAEAMRVLGLAQRYGAGIPTARRALRDNGQPEPDFRVEANWVHCTVRGRM